MYPYLNVRLDAIRNNAMWVCRYCKAHNIEVAGVLKFANAAPEIVRTYYRGGCHELCASRISQIKQIRGIVPQAKTMLLRLPMACEISDVVQWCDTSLNSSEETLRLLNEEAERQGKQHAVLLMLDVGDLREGVMTSEELVRLAVLCEQDLPHLYLRGVGTTFGCFGLVQPDGENLGMLVSAAEAVEKAIGRRLETISGGSSSSLLPLQRGEMPKRVNHLRIGGYIANPMGMRIHRDFALEGVDENTFLLCTQIIEVGEKPSIPFGRIRDTNWKGEARRFEDHGVCHRGITAIGEADVEDVTKLLPTDKDVSIMGGSSDHLIFRIDGKRSQYKVGDVITFRLFYSALMHCYLAPSVEKRYTGWDPEMTDGGGLL